jgi:hypothetical protein
MNIKKDKENKSSLFVSLDSAFASDNQAYLEAELSQIWKQKLLTKISEVLM